MLALLDESGDSGLKFGRNSSLYFTLTLVLFGDLEAAMACDQRIDRLRKELGTSENFEFHFSKTSRPLRGSLSSPVVSGYEFAYFALMLNKQRLIGKAWRDRAYFYQEAVRLVLDAAKPHLLASAKVIFDQSNDRTFNQELAK